MQHPVDLHASQFLHIASGVPPEQDSLEVILCVTSTVGLGILDVVMPVGSCLLLIGLLLSIRRLLLLLLLLCLRLLARRLDRIDGAHSPLAILLLNELRGTIRGDAVLVIYAAVV
jgi:hypothetical protein